MIAIVTSLAGSATVLSECGTSYNLRVGDELQLGDVVITAAGSRVEIQSGTETPFVIAENTEFLINDELFGNGVVASESEILDETVATIVEAFETNLKAVQELSSKDEPKTEEPVTATRAEIASSDILDSDIAAILDALETGGDLLDALEAPAAGAPGGAGGAGNEGHGFVRLGRIGYGLEKNFHHAFEIFPDIPEDEK